MLLLILYSNFTTGGIDRISDGRSLLSFDSVGIGTYTVSNVTLVRSLTLIDSASVAILGASNRLRHGNWYHIDG